MGCGCVIRFNYWLSFYILGKKYFCPLEVKKVSALFKEFQVAQNPDSIKNNSYVEKDASQSEVRPDWDFDDEFDGGDETCGRVIVNLHLYIRDQAPGYTILVISRDPAAPLEMASWCRLTKNRLVAQQHPYYLITLKPHLTGEKNG